MKSTLPSFDIACMMLLRMLLEPRPIKEDNYNNNNNNSTTCFDYDVASLLSEDLMEDDDEDLPAQQEVLSSSTTSYYISLLQGQSQSHPHPNPNPNPQPSKEETTHNEENEEHPDETTLPSKSSVGLPLLDSDSSSSSSTPALITDYQTLRWNQRFQELVKFKHDYGNCLVPTHWPQNATLSQWVKRQRYQWKLQTVPGKKSSLTRERLQHLNDIGFVWDSHSLCWEERLCELVLFREEHGHCNVPTKYLPNPQLAIWSKCQRRQYKLFCTQGAAKSNLTAERITKLMSYGFVFDPRAFRKKGNSSFIMGAGSYHLK